MNAKLRPSTEAGSAEPPSRPAAPSVASASGPRVRLGDVPALGMTLIGRLDLAAVILTLFACLIAYQEPLTLDYGVVAVLSVIACSRILTPADLRSTIGLGSVSPSVVARVFVEWVSVVGLLLLAGFALKVSDWFSRSVMLTWFLATPLVLIGAQELQVQLARWLGRRGVLTSRHVIVGAGRAGVELARRLPRASLLGFFDFRRAERLLDLDADSVLLGHCGKLGDFVRQRGVNAVYITLPIANAPRIRDLLADLRNTTASVYFVPDVFAFELIQARVVDLNGLPALAVCDTPLRGSNALAKRAVDLTLASLALVVLSPLFLAVALAIKLTSRGPVLFKQRRYGLDGGEIVVFKFRSMAVCEDGATIRQASSNDDRVTALGRLLRNTSIDELPQLINVLEGTMSLVGPRPHAVAHNELYRGQISGYMVRHKVRPGITGWAQVHGLRGETDTVDKMEQRVRYDLEYLNNWSLALDVKILLKTVVVVLRGHNAY